MRYFFTGLFAVLAFFVHAQTPYPKVAGYVGIVHPIVTFDKNGTHTNFDGYYQVGIPIGINIWKSERVAFSVELVPFIRVEDSISKMNNFLLHPGVLVPLGHGFTFAGRAAFETSGRYGITPVFIKTIKKNTSSSYYVAVPLPLRFGNNKPASFTTSVQLGFAF